MNEPSSRFWSLFFEIYEALPRQGPGNRATAERALGMCTELPARPEILDLGCGVGGQTLHLAEFTQGRISAVDNHAPSIARLEATVASRGLEERVTPIVGDMATVQLPAGSFDLIWSEGALYNLGLEVALARCRELLRPGGYLVFSDAVWLKAEPPEAVKLSFELDYPSMGWVSDVLARIASAGLDVIQHFRLPDQAWWEDFYTPMEARIEELQRMYASDVEALGILAGLAEEPKLHRSYSDYYGYEVFVARKLAD